MTQGSTNIANEALALHQQNRLADAIVLYEQALADDPQPPRP